MLLFLRSTRKKESQIEKNKANHLLLSHAFWCVFLAVSLVRDRDCVVTERRRDPTNWAVWFGLKPTGIEVTHVRSEHTQTHCTCTFLFSSGNPIPTVQDPGLIGLRAKYWVGFEVF